MRKAEEVRSHDELRLNQTYTACDSTDVVGVDGVRRFQTAIMQDMPFNDMRGFEPVNVITYLDVDTTHNKNVRYGDPNKQPSEFCMLIPKRRPGVVKFYDAANNTLRVCGMTTETPRGSSLYCHMKCHSPGMDSENVTPYSDFEIAEFAGKPSYVSFMNSRSLKPNTRMLHLVCLLPESLDRFLKTLAVVEDRALEQSGVDQSLHLIDRALDAYKEDPRNFMLNILNKLEDSEVAAVPLLRELGSPIQEEQDLPAEATTANEELLQGSASTWDIKYPVERTGGIDFTMREESNVYETQFHTVNNSVFHALPSSTLRTEVLYSEKLKQPVQHEIASIW
jgi:hypothetical protein